MVQTIFYRAPNRTKLVNLEADTEGKMNKEKIKKRKTYDLRLTLLEVVHLRDLFSVVLPPDTRKTMSQHLAELEDRSYIEERLWDKLASLCKEANLPVDEEAPDYIVAPLSPPPMGVFHLSGDEDFEQDEPRGFIKSEEE